jgi:ATP-dependent Clp protease ATP-binding subunit ClpB
VLDVVGKHFRPEFLNRIDEVVVFHPLAKNQVRDIADIQVKLLQKRLDEMDLHLHMGGGVLDKISELGFDPVYGARPLKRAIQQWIENPLAQKVLGGSYTPGDAINVDVEDGEIVFS